MRPSMSPRGFAAAISLVILVAVTSCSPQPAASTPTSGSPSAPVTASPSATATPTAAVTALRTTVPLPSFAEISAPSGTVVWALVGGVLLFRSLDRGDTWEQRPLPASLQNPEIAFVNDREGWLSLAGSPATQCQFQTIAIWHTTDAGTRWEKLSASGIADAMCKGALSFSDASLGSIDAYSPNAPPVIYRTTDGGRTWGGSLPLPDPPGFTTQPGGLSLQPGAVRSFGSISLLPAQGSTAAGRRLYVFRSRDGGASWTYAATAPRSDGPLVIVTATRWLRIVPASGAQETTDGGVTWHAYVTDYQQAAPVDPMIVFGDPNVAFATVRGAIQRTVDGGAHWTPVKTPGTG